MSKVHKLVAVSESLNLENGVITYKVSTGGQEALPLSDNEVGLVYLPNDNFRNDMIIINQVYSGGELLIHMKPLKLPARKFKINEEIAQLVVCKVNG